MKEDVKKISGKAMRKATFGVTVLMLAAFGLSACIVADPGYRRGGDWHRQHWNNDNWNGNGPGNGPGGGHWKRYP